MNTLLDVTDRFDYKTSLREAITFANSAMGADRITFAPGLTGTVLLGSALPGLSTDLTIGGPGATQLTVERRGQPSLSHLHSDGGR